MNWKKTLAAVAPTVATALGGPMGGMVANMALTGLGIDAAEGEDPERLLQKAVQSANPETMAQLKRIDADVTIRLEELGVDLERIRAEDRKGAREMADKTGIWPQVTLSLIYVGGFVGILYLLFMSSLELSDMQWNAAMYLLGILSAGLGQIMNFWFGSSSGSKDKTVALSGGRG